jgi:uronate dehydrogenase
MSPGPPHSSDDLPSLGFVDRRRKVRGKYPNFLSSPENALKKRIVITGAAGNIGSKIAEALRGSYELILLDLRRGPHAAIRRADLSRYPLRPDLRGWPRLFEGSSAIVHCGGDPRPTADRRVVLRDNIEATWNVLEAAASQRVPRVVYASSNRVVKRLQVDLGPDRFQPSGPKIPAESFPRPLSAYGFSKAAAELLGRMFVDQQRLQTFVSVRIGNCTIDGKPNPTDAAARSHWISDRDMVRLLRRCVEAPLSGYHVVYGVSAQPESPFDLSSTCRLLEWEPLDRTGQSGEAD